ncbi:sigma-70 family RNA polymerase sigma factor [Synechococcus elongatus]|uniref:sigma-70 family RNA polymerase sigma factor n=1 Tax=Synechococcus elongatus TaxID=32046 RepID=UPI000F7F4FFC|nr:sigma-70 family RNA polymerase sigma factor [Synechococcus elongatus]
MDIIWGNRDDLKTFLKEIGKYPLLKPVEEIELGRRVKRLTAIKDACEGRLDKLDLQRYAETHDLSMSEVEQAVRSGRAAKSRMITGNLRLVISIAKKFQHRGVELLDLVQEGVLGLEKAIDRFDPDKGFRFSTFSYWWIRQAIARLTASNSRAMKLPIHIAGKVSKLERLSVEAKANDAVLPPFPQLAKELEVSVARLHDLIECSKPCVSLDAKGCGSDSTPGDYLESTNADPLALLCNQEDQDAIADVVDSLPPQDRAVFILRWGLAEEKPLSAAKTGELLNISKDEVRVREATTMRLIRERVL